MAQGLVGPTVSLMTVVPVFRTQCDDTRNKTTNKNEERTKAVDANNWAIRLADSYFAKLRTGCGIGGVPGGAPIDHC